MTVVNTSPVIHLNAVLPQGLSLLPSLFGQVIVPYEVLGELASGNDRDDAFYRVQTPKELNLRQRPVAIDSWLSSEIDLGEAAVIQTALNEGIDSVILDDLKARRIARRLGLSVTGTLGVLILAKQTGHLESIRETIDQLIHRGMWLDAKVIKTALRISGE